MSGDAETGESSQQPAAAGKWVPRWRQTPNAVPSIRMYSEFQIRDAIPGEMKSHTFTRAIAPGNDLASDPADTAPESLEHNGKNNGTPESLADEFCRIMVHDKAHLNPPRELWTRNNFEQFDVNIGRPLPLFQESPARGRLFEFLGWYRIVSWTRCAGGGKEVLDFIQKRRISKTARTPEYWDHALKDDWARVVLEKVNDSSLGNPMERKE